MLTAGSLLVLILDVTLPRRWDRSLSWFTVAVLAAAAVALLAADGVTVTVARGLVAVDGFAFFFKLLFLVSAALTVAMSPRYLSIEGVRPGEYYFLVLCATLGMMFMAGGHRPHHALHRPRDDGGVVLRAHGIPAAEPALERSGHQVLPPRRVLARDPAVRHVAALRAHRQHAPADDRDVARGRRRRAAAAVRGDAPRRRRRVQDCGGAVSHVGPRRVRRRADADHRVSLGRVEDRVLRDAPADLRRGPAGVPDGRARHDLGAAARVERVLLRARRGDDDGRQHRGADAGEHQADARVLVDRARAGTCSSASSPARRAASRRRWST